MQVPPTRRTPATPAFLHCARTGFDPINPRKRRSRFWSDRLSRRPAESVLIHIHRQRRTGNCLQFRSRRQCPLEPGKRAHAPELFLCVRPRPQAELFAQRRLRTQGSHGICELARRFRRDDQRSARLFEDRRSLTGCRDRSDDRPAAREVRGDLRREVRVRADSPLDDDMNMCRSQQVGIVVIRHRWRDLNVRRGGRQSSHLGGRVTCPDDLEADVVTRQAGGLDERLDSLRVSEVSRVQEPRGFEGFSRAVMLVLGRGRPSCGLFRSARARRRAAPRARRKPGCIRPDRRRHGNGLLHASREPDQAASTWAEIVERRGCA